MALNSIEHQHPPFYRHQVYQEFLIPQLIKGHLLDLRRGRSPWTAWTHVTTIGMGNMGLDLSQHK